MVGKREIGVGLIGAGFMGKSHANAYHTLRYIDGRVDYDARLVCIGDLTEPRAAEAARRYGFADYAVGWDGIVGRKDVDLVDICIADSEHRQAALDAITKGKHVLCEKPLAVTAADARLVWKAGEKAGGKYMCGFNYRFLPAVRLAYELIRAGVIGRIYNFNGVYSQDTGCRPETPVEKLWYAGGTKGNGVALGIGCHLVDMARFLVGEMESVSGRVVTYNKIRPSANGPVEVKQDEAMVAAADFACGATGLLQASAVAFGRLNQLTFELSGSKGSLTFDLENPNILEVCLSETAIPQIAGFTRVNVTQMDRSHPFADIWWPRGHGIGWEHAHINEIAHLLDCIANNKPVAPYGATFEDGYKAIAVIEAIKESGATGRRVSVRYSE